MTKVIRDKIILGIDPGSRIMGYGLVKIINGRPSMLDLGTLELKGSDDFYIRLSKIYSKIIELIEYYLPDELSIESQFFGKNVQSMLKLGRAQGVAIAAAISRELPVFEYAPLKVKMAITGNGKASKEQVAYMLTQIFPEIKKIDNLKLDASDALGVAYCHYLQCQNPLTSSKKTDWKSFIKNNPDRII